MAIILYHDTPSSNSDRVKIALAEKSLGWDGVLVRLANKEQKKPEFLKLNPYGKIPVLVDDGQVLFESCIINEYLNEKYPDPPLMPKDPYLRGQMRKPDADRNAAVLKDTRESLRNLLSYMEEALGDKDYFLGALSLTDIAILPRFLRMETYGALPTQPLPRIGAWLQRMKARPSVKAIL